LAREKFRSENEELILEVSPNVIESMEVIAVENQRRVSVLFISIFMLLNIFSDHQLFNILLTC
jgi:hypothetical protein